MGFLKAANWELLSIDLGIPNSNKDTLVDDLELHRERNIYWDALKAAFELVKE